MYTKNPKIELWKRKYGKVYRTRIMGDDFYFRAMNIGEFRKISMIDDLEQKELAILSIGVLFPDVKTLDDLISGTAEKLILYISNVTNITDETMMQKVSEARDRLGITDNILSLQIEIIKCLNYTPKQVEAMSLEEFVEAVVLAEAMLGKPLIAAGKDDGQGEPTITVDSQTQPSPVELGDMKSIDQMENVANKNAVGLRESYLRKKRMRTSVRT